MKCIGDYLYCTQDDKIIRYEPNEERILNGEKLISFNGNINHFVCSFHYGLVVIGEKS